ncbi:hypothetical protein AMATHDRAFT_122967, partial [Amanita thiersii Skay4041]
REALVWSRINHPNVVPLYGISWDFDRQDNPCLVFPYYQSGDLVTYLKKFPQADRLLFLTQIASALTYLHGHEPFVVHGDIKGSNILVNDKDEACLTDFGFSRMLESTGFTTKNLGGTCRWMAFELLDEHEEDADQAPKPTTATDVWAFAMTILEIFTDKPPFAHLSYDVTVIFHVIKGRLPKQPPEIIDDLWCLLLRCWRAAPECRPQMTSIL